MLLYTFGTFLMDKGLASVQLAQKERGDTVAAYSLPMAGSPSGSSPQFASDALAVGTQIMEAGSYWNSLK